MLSKINKKTIWLFIYHNFLIVLGSVLLGFGTAIFLSKNFIVAGGLSGIAFIVQYHIPEGTMIIDIVVWIATGLLWFLSLFTLGKQFAFRTLLASIIFPLSLTLFYRIPAFDALASHIAAPDGATTTGDLLLCAIFGGISMGAGVALTFLGKGSTGGVDVIAFIINKYFNIKVSVASLFIDCTIILVGVFALDFPSKIVNCLVGIISAAVCSLMVELIYSRKQNGFILDIISNHWEEITKYIIDEMERGVSLIDVEGAYTGQKRKMIRTVLSKNEYIQIKEFIASVDPNAFMTFTDTNAVFGEGFKENFGYSKIFKKKNKK